MYFICGYATQLCGLIPKKESEIQLLAASSQTLGYLSSIPWPAKLPEKFSKKVSLANSLQGKKYDQLFFIERIWQSLKFDKSSYYPFHFCCTTYP
jgi:hypothetical protein